MFTSLDKMIGCLILVTIIMTYAFWCVALGLPAIAWFLTYSAGVPLYWAGKFYWRNQRGQ